MSLGKIVLAGALLMSPAFVMAGPPQVRQVSHCASCGVDAPSCGCDTPVCSSCPPPCRPCLCLPPVIPNLLNGVDRLLTGLFTCHCRPACNAGCCDGCGVETCDSGCSDCVGGSAYHHSGAHSPAPPTPTPATDALNNPFQDDPVPSARRYANPRYRGSAVSPSSPYSRGRVSRVPSRYGQYRQPAKRPTPSASPRVAQAAATAPADRKPRIVKVEYAKPLTRTPQRAKTVQPTEPTLPLPAEPKRVATATAQPLRSTSDVPVNPLR